MRLFDCRLNDAEIAAANIAMASGILAAGPNVQEFEGALGHYLGAVDQVVAMGDMTNALAMALRLGGVRKGDEVLTLAFNCLASTTAIAMIGAIPSWVDVDPATATFCLVDAERALTSRTKAIVVYHVAGYPADTAAVRKFSDDHGLLMVEDANNALGASFAGVATGALGDFSVFSFYANRQVNGIEGAALKCSTAFNVAAARRLRRFGIDAQTFRDISGEIDPRADVPLLGISSTMSNINAGVALSHLESLDVRLEKNRANVHALEVPPLRAVKPIEREAASNPSFWTWLVRSVRRDELMAWLKQHGIPCSKLHQRNDIYSGFGAATRPLPGTNTLQREMLALPCGWWLSETELRAISEALANFDSSFGK